MTILVARSYQTEDEYWRIRNFLRQVFVLNNRHMFSWPIARLDYWRWHGIGSCGLPSQKWETLPGIRVFWMIMQNGMASP